MATWNELLRKARDGTGLSRRAVAELSGLSEETIFSYEATRRNPRRERLLQLTRALKLDGAATNAILTDAALEPEPSPWLRDAALRARPLSELQGALDSYSWPCLALNERFEIVAWNQQAVRVAELDFRTALPESHQRNLLRIAVPRHFRERVQNWDEVVSVMVGMYKNHHMGSEDLAEGSPYFQSMVTDIARNDGDFLARLMGLWANTPARKQATRIVFRVAWRTGEGTPLSFNCLITAWDEFDAISRGRVLFPSRATRRTTLLPPNRPLPRRTAGWRSARAATRSALLHPAERPLRLRNYP